VQRQNLRLENLKSLGIDYDFPVMAT